MISEENIEKLNEALSKSLKEGKLKDATEIAKELNNAREQEVDSYANISSFQNEVRKIEIEEKRAETEALNVTSRAENERRKIASNEKIEEKKLKKPWYDYVLDGLKIAVPIATTYITYKLGIKKIETTKAMQDKRFEKMDFYEQNRYGITQTTLGKSEMRREDRIRDYD